MLYCDNEAKFKMVEKHYKRRKGDFMKNKKRWGNLLMILLGNTMYAIAVAVFILPNGLITGGTTGLALFTQYLCKIPVSLFVVVFNLIMFLIGAVVLGKSFAVTTVVSTFYYPAVLHIMERIINGKQFTNDMMLATIFAGLLVGAGIGLVIRAGASTGGMDIPPLILNKKFGLSVSVMLYVFDVLILCLQIFFSNTEQTLYGMLMVLVYTVVLDKVLVLGSSQIQVKIISKEYEIINSAIQQKLDCGSTLYMAEGGHLREESRAILTVIHGRDLSKLNEIVMELDPEAFLIISKVNEVRGRGFTIGKKYMNKKTS